MKRKHKLIFVKEVDILNKDCLSDSADTQTMNTNTFFPLFTYHPITVLVHNETVESFRSPWQIRRLQRCFCGWSHFPQALNEWLLLVFETRGFCSRRSLAYMQTEDLDSFFPSPTKLLLAERRILEAELNKIKAENNRQSTQREPKWLNVLPTASTAEELERNVPAVLTRGGCQQHWSDHPSKPNPKNLS